MEEIIDKLSHILQEIESYHGVIQDGKSHRYVRRLHQQARDHVTELHTKNEQTHQRAMQTQHDQSQPTE